MEASDAECIAGNAAVLGTVESAISSLEQMFAGLESLKTEKDRLSAAVQSLHTEEAQILQDGASESVIVKKLLETRGRRDVQSSRLNDVQDMLKSAQADLTSQGQAVRRLFASAMSQLLVSRQARALVILTELFGGPYVRLRMGRTELTELVHHTEMVKQIKVVWGRVSQAISDPVQELAALQRTRTWLAEVADLVTREPGLMFKGLPAKQQLREMVTA